MRFGSHLKYFNYYKDETKKEQFEFKNIQAYVQEVINDLKKSINWKDYTSQLRGGWTKSSKFVEERRKEIFKKLNVLIINNSFISENSEKLNKILENSLRKPQNWKNELNDLIKNFANQEEKDLMIKNFDILHEHNKFRINEEPIDVNNITRLPSVFSSCDTEFGILGNTIISNNLDFVEMLIIKKPEFLASKCKNNWTALHLAANTGRMKSVELLLDKAKELYKDKPEEFNKFINSKDIFGSTPLYEATDKAEINKKKYFDSVDYMDYTKVVKLLLEYGAYINIVNNCGTPLHLAVMGGYKEIVQLLLANAKELYKDKPEEFENYINMENKYKNTALMLAKSYIHNEIVELLDRVMELNKKIKNYEKLTPEKKETLKIEITKKLEENKEKIKKLLNPEAEAQSSGNDISNYSKTFAGLKNIFQKPKTGTSSSRVSVGEQADTSGIQQPLSKNLSEVIAQTALGEISDKQEQTILNRIRELNSHLDISKVKIKENSITHTAATVESIDQSVYLYPDDAVKVTFTLAKKLSKPSKTQKTITEDKSNYGGFKPGFLNPSTKSNSSSKRVSVGEQAGTSGTQNQKTRVTNQNNLYDVPADNSCLFWSVSTSYLLPVRNNNEEFRNRFIQLFGEENLKYLWNIQKLLQNYDLRNNRSLNQLWYQDQTANNLVISFFRNSVVHYIQSNLDTIPNRDGELTFRSLIQDNNEIDTNYLERMRQPSTWGGVGRQK